MFSKEGLQSAYYVTSICGGLIAIMWVIVNLRIKEKISDTSKEYDTKFVSGKNLETELSNYVRVKDHQKDLENHNDKLLNQIKEFRAESKVDIGELKKVYKSDSIELKKEMKELLKSIQNIKIT